VGVGRPTSIGEGYYGAMNSSRWWGWDGGGANYSNAAQAGAGGGVDGSTIPLGQIGVSARVTMTFALEGR
jgi:hypothetical protein